MVLQALDELIVVNHRLGNGAQHVRVRLHLQVNWKTFRGKVSANQSEGTLFGG